MSTTLPDNATRKKEQDDLIWQTYLDAAKSEDEARPKNWEGSTTGILTFTGLFAATVAAFIIESYRLLSPDPTDRTNLLLEQLFVAMANATSQTPIIVPPPASFSLSASAVATNAFWFSSLLISLICALLATLVQEWSRNYVQDISKRRVLWESMRLQAFNHIYIRMGVDKYGMDGFVSWIVTLLHLSVFLFACGLLIFLYPINFIVAGIATGVLGIFMIIYAVGSVLPILDQSCPYRTPVSYFMALLLWLALRSYRSMSHLRCRYEREHSTSDGSEDSDAKEIFNKIELNRVIAREYTSKSGDFLTVPRFMFAWKHTVVHVPVDIESQDAFYKGLSHLISDKPALQDHLSSNEVFLQNLRTHVKNAYILSTPVDSEVFYLVAQLAAVRLHTEFEHPSRFLPTAHGLIRESLEYISWIADRDARLSAHLCIAYLRHSLSNLCEKADSMRTSRLRDYHTSGISTWLTLGTRGLSGTLYYLHEDDCCKDRTSFLNPERLPHARACHILTIVTHILRSTATERRQVPDSLLQPIHAMLSNYQYSQSDGIPETLTNRIPSDDFISTLRMAGLQHWMESENDELTLPEFGPYRGFLERGDDIASSCPRALQGLARQVDFRAYWERAAAARSSSDQHPAPVWRLPSTVTGEQNGGSPGIADLTKVVVEENREQPEAAVSDTGVATDARR